MGDIDSKCSKKKKKKKNYSSKILGVFAKQIKKSSIVQQFFQIMLEIKQEEEIYLYHELEDVG